MKKPLVKRSFNGGEVAPTLYWRDDIEKIPQSCLTMRNFLVHPHGAAERRRGFTRWADITEQVKGG